MYVEETDEDDEPVMHVRRKVKYFQFLSLAEKRYEYFSCSKVILPQFILTVG